MVCGGFHLLFFFVGWQSGRPTSSYFVVDVGGALRGHLLDDVDWMAVVSAHLLVVRAVGRIGSPQRDDDVAGLRAVVVATATSAAAPLGRGERGERKWRVVRFRVLGVSPAVTHHADHGRNQQEEGGASGSPSNHRDIRGRQGAVLSSSRSPTRTGNSGKCGVSSGSWEMRGDFELEPVQHYFISIY